MYQVLLNITLSIWLCSLSHAQSILCFSAEDSTSIKSFDVYAASDDFKSIEKRIESTDFKNYVGKSICVKTQGFADTCFYLKSGLSEIYLNLNHRMLNPVAIISTNDSRTKFTNKLDSFLFNVRRQDKILLEYKLNIMVTEETHYNIQNITSKIYVEQPAFRAFSPFLTFHFDSLQFTSNNNASSNTKLDSLNVLPLLYSVLNESFWIGNKEIKKLISRNESGDRSSNTFHYSHDSLDAFLTNYNSIINNEKINFGDFSFAFDKENRLIEYLSYDSTFINPFVKNGPSRKLKHLQIKYSEVGLHYPKLISTILSINEQSKYNVKIEMTINKVSPQYYPNHQKVIPMYAWNMSTLAWLRHHGITVKNG